MILTTHHNEMLKLMCSKVVANWTEASLHTAGETMRPLNEMSKDQTKGAPKPQW